MIIGRPLGTRYRCQGSTLYRAILLSGIVGRQGDDDEGDDDEGGDDEGDDDEENKKSRKVNSRNSVTSSAVP